MSNTTYTHLQVESALCVWECLDQRSNDASRYPDIAAYRDGCGTAELRHLSIPLGLYCLSVYDQLPEALIDGLAYDGDVIPAILDTLDWTQVPAVPPVEQGVLLTAAALQTLQCNFVVRPVAPNPLYTDEPVMPPAKTYLRALPRRLFDQRFAPIPKRPHDLTHDRVPAGADERHWWTVVTGPLSSRWHIYPGIGHGDDEQYIQCRHPWGGNAADHPYYVY